MKEKNGINSIWAVFTIGASVGAICTAAGLVALALFMGKLPKNTIKEVDLAAWFQAIGSVLAIIVAAGAVFAAHVLESRRNMDMADRERRRQQEQDQARFDKSTTFSLHLATRTLRVLKDVVALNGKEPASHSHFETWIRALRSIESSFEVINPADLEGVEELRIHLNMRNYVNSAIVELHRYIGPTPPRNEQLVMNLTKAIDLVNTAVQDARATMSGSASAEASDSPDLAAANA